MAKQISSYTDPKHLATVMKNAMRQGRDDVYYEALRRRCELIGLNYNDPLERDFHAMLTAYEELLTEKNQRRTAASRTRQKLKNKGVVECLEDWARGHSETVGFKSLIDAGLIELTGEYLVTKYPERFTAEAVRRAKERLSSHAPDEARP
jgi:hypothetical protein